MIRRSLLQGCLQIYTGTTELSYGMAPIVAACADRFSRLCCQWFSCVH